MSRAAPRGGAQLRQQAVERGALRASRHGRRRWPAMSRSLRRPPATSGAADEWILERCARDGRRPSSGLCASTSSAASRTCSTTRSGASTATGTWRWPRRHLRRRASGPTRVATWRTLTWVLDRYLRLLHPLMPHVTEEIWGAPAASAGGPGPAHRGAVARQRPTRQLPQAGRRATGVEALIELITAMRAARAEAGIAAGGHRRCLDLASKEPAARGASSLECRRSSAWRAFAPRSSTTGGTERRRRRVRSPS